MTIKAKAFTIKLLITIFILSTQKVCCQQNKVKEKIGNGFYITPTQLVFSEILISYERFNTQRFSINYSLGGKIATGGGTKRTPYGNGIFAVYEYQHMFNVFSNGLYASAAPTFYRQNNRKSYYQIEPFYRFYWVNNRRFSYNNYEGENFNAKRTERIHSFGFKLLAGQNFTVFFKSKRVLNFKVYGGLGIRYKHYSYVNVDNRFENFDGTKIEIPYAKETGSLVRPSVHLCVKIGLINKK